MFTHSRIMPVKVFSNTKPTGQGWSATLVHDTIADKVLPHSTPVTDAIDKNLSITTSIQLYV